MDAVVLRAVGARRGRGPGRLEVRDLFISDAADGVTLATGVVIVPSANRCHRLRGRGGDEPPRLIVLDAKYRIATAELGRKVAFANGMGPIPVQPMGSTSGAHVRPEGAVGGT